MEAHFVNFDPTRDSWRHTIALLLSNYDISLTDHADIPSVQGLPLIEDPQIIIILHPGASQDRFKYMPQFDLRQGRRVIIFCAASGSVAVITTPIQHEYPIKQMPCRIDKADKLAHFLHGAIAVLW